MSRIVLIGGGHVNCQVLKMLKSLAPEGSLLTMVSESDRSYYSGMLPGSTANIYSPKEIQVELKPLAAWCKADFIEQKVKAIIGDDNKLELEDGSTVDYDVLAINVGSRTKDTYEIPGVHEHSLTTRPINDLLGKIERKEQELKENNITPKVVVCGAGCAGVELSFGFKNRWEEFFGTKVETTLLSSQSEILPGEKDALRGTMMEKLKNQNIDVHTSCRVAEVTKDGVRCEDGRTFEGNVVVWSTGAEPQPVTFKSDLDTSKGYFRVNEYMQSTSHPNIFAGGDCVTMAPYEDKEKVFPPKAGVYAVRSGPVIANNVANYIKKKDLQKYEPQGEFLALLMTGDRRAVGSKFGFSFNGKWVWNMKDFIDVGFMHLFDPHRLFKDYDTKGTAEPVDNSNLFDVEEKKSEDKAKQDAKDKVDGMSPEEGAKSLQAGEDHEDFMEQFMVLGRMKDDEEFRKGVQSVLC